MGSTFFSIHFHVVFSTKERIPLIRPEWRRRLFEYLGGTVRGLGSVAEAVGGAADHVHLLIGARTTSVPADLVRELKKASSIWAGEKFDRGFSWQDGYSIFSVSRAHVALVRNYILGQEIHHSRLSFKDEWKQLLDLNGVDYDPKYLC